MDSVRVRSRDDGDSVVVAPCSLVPLIQRRHRLLKTALRAVPVVDISVISSDILSEQALMQSVLNHHCASICSGTWTPDAGGVALVEWSDGTVGCTRDTDGLAQELQLREAAQLLLPAGRSASISGTELSDDELLASLARRGLQCSERMEHEACLQNLRRLRRPEAYLQSSETPAWNVTSCAVNDARNVVPRRYFAWDGQNSSSDAFLDLVFVFTVEVPLTTNHSCHLRLSEVQQRIQSGAVKCSADVLWKLVCDALADVTRRRFDAMYDICRIERNRTLRLELRDEIAKLIQWYCNSPNPADVFAALHAHPLMARWMEHDAHFANCGLLQDPASSAPLAASTTVNEVEHRFLDSCSPKGFAAHPDEAALAVVKAFVAKHRRTMKPHELAGLLPKS